MRHTENNKIYFSITLAPALTKSFLDDLNRLQASAKIKGSVNYGQPFDSSQTILLALYLRTRPQSMTEALYLNEQRS